MPKGDTKRIQNQESNYRNNNRKGFQSPSGFSKGLLKFFRVSDVLHLGLVLLQAHIEITAT